MAQETQAPHPSVLFTDHDRHVIALSAYAGFYLGEMSDVTVTLAAFGPEKIVLHTFKSADVFSGGSASPADAQQITLTVQEMDTLLERYQAYRKAQQEQAAASPISRDGDPFLPEFPDE